MQVMPHVCLKSRSILLEEIERRAGMSRDEKMMCSKWFFEGSKMRVAFRQSLEDLRCDV